MEDAFEKLRKEGKNDVEHLTQWMKDAKIIDEAKASEEKARAILKEFSTKQKIELAKFKLALAKLAEEQGKSLEEYTKRLNEKSEKLANALNAAAEAFRAAMK